MEKIKLEDNSPIPEKGKSEISPEQNSIEKAPKLEWGQELGNISWNDAQEKIEELNSNLKEGEKEWRLPTAGELFREFEKHKIKPPRGFNKVLYIYWSSSFTPQTNRQFIETFNMKTGASGHGERHNLFSVRLVRDIV